MGDLEFRAKVGLFIKLITSPIILMGVFLIIYLIVNQRSSTIEIIIGLVLVLLPLLILVMAVTTKYVFTEEGLKIKTSASFFMLREDYLENVVPYVSITDYYETRDVTHSISFSFDALRINYIKRNGRKDSFVISPADKANFISELGRRTGKELSTVLSKKQ